MEHKYKGKEYYKRMQKFANGECKCGRSRKVSDQDRKDDKVLYAICGKCRGLIQEYRHQEVVEDKKEI